MRDLLYFAAAVLAIIWLVGYFGYNSGESIHLLMVAAMLIVLLRLSMGRKLL